METFYAVAACFPLLTAWLVYDAHRAERIIAPGLALEARARTTNRRARR